MTNYLRCTKFRCELIPPAVAKCARFGHSSSVYSEIRCLFSIGAAGGNAEVFWRYCLQTGVTFGVTFVQNGFFVLKIARGFFQWFRNEIKIFLATTSGKYSTNTYVNILLNNTEGHF